MPDEGFRSGVSGFSGFVCRVSEKETSDLMGNIGA